MHKVFFVLVCTVGLGITAWGQQFAPTDGQSKLSTILAQRIDAIPRSSVSQEARSKAYAKFLEAQRFYWLLGNSRKNRTQAAYISNVKGCRDALLVALDTDPFIAEGYTILSELAISAPPGDIDEALELAKLAVRVNKDNFGARRIIARLITYKSGVSTNSPDAKLSLEAIEAWKQVASLDPRNAEAWAFLSLFYEKSNNQKDRIEALQKWIAAAPPLDSQFFQRITGGGEVLSTENASMKLADAYVAAGRTADAVEILSQLISDDPSNTQAVDLLRDAVSSSKQAGASGAAIRAITQAVNASPGNISLATLLADLYADAGRVTEGAKVLKDAAARTTDRPTAGMYYVLLGDLYERVEQHSEALRAYEQALSIRGLAEAQGVSDDERTFATQLFQRMVRSARAGGREVEIRPILERAKKILGPEDDFADRELISLYREGGKRQEALTLVKSLRAKHPKEEGIARLEATLLTELGRVDEAVSGYKAYNAERMKGNPTAGSTPDSPPVDEFSNLLFISQLYTQANRTKDAIVAANQSLAAARGTERKQIALLTLASAQQMGGDHAGAEATLREILKESPNNPIALNNLGYFLVERNIRLDEALKMIQQAVEVDPTNPSYLDSLGWVHFKLGRLMEAEKYLKDAARQDSLSSTIAEHLGDVYHKQGRAEDAKRQWKRALELATEKTDVERLRGKLK